jgi:hypothetical protein
MKYTFLIVITLLSFNTFLSGQPQQKIIDTIQQSPDTISSVMLQDQVTDLEEQLNDLERKVISFGSNREYASDILTIIGLFFTLMVGASAYIGFIHLPRKQKEQYEAFEKRANQKFAELQEKISKTDINANRAHYSMAKERKSYMTVVWCGRWLEAIYSAGRKINNNPLKGDILKILKETNEILFNHTKEDLEKLKSFRGKGGVIENFQLIIIHKDNKIRIVATDILQFLQKFWYNGNQDSSNNDESSSTPPNNTITEA